MQDSNRQESDYRQPVWKTASVSITQPKYIRNSFSVNPIRIHRQIILYETATHESKKTGELNQPLVSDNQVESGMESSFEITAAYEPEENQVTKCVTDKSNQPPTHDALLALEVNLEMISDFEVAAEFQPEENELNNHTIRKLDQPLIHDKLPALEVELEMNSDYESTVLFEPCGNQPELEVEMEMVEDIQNRIQALEERVIQLESMITRLIEIDQSHKNRSVIPLNGSMVAPACGCGVCSVESQE